MERNPVFIVKLPEPMSVDVQTQVAEAIRDARSRLGFEHGDINFRRDESTEDGRIEVAIIGYDRSKDQRGSWPLHQRVWCAVVGTLDNNDISTPLAVMYV